MNVKHIVICLIMISASIAGITFVQDAKANGNTFYVDGDGGGDFTSISLALADPSVTDGDTIIVTSGNYTDNVDVDKRVTIRGVAQNPPTIFPSSTSYPVFDINIDSVTLEGMFIQGSTSTPIPVCGVQSDVSVNEHYGIYLIDLDISEFQVGIKICRTNANLAYPYSHTIESCCIHDNCKGVHIEADPTGSIGWCTIIESCQIYSNNLDYSYYSVGVEIHGALNYIKNTDIHGHYTEIKTGIGIFLDNADQNDIYQYYEEEGDSCDIYQNDMAIYLYQSCENDVRDGVNIYSNGAFMWEGTGSEYILLEESNENFFYDVNIYNNVNVFRIEESSGNEIEECYILDNDAFYDPGTGSNWNMIDLEDSDSNIIGNCTMTRDEDDESCILIGSDSDSNYIQFFDEFDGWITIQYGSDTNTVQDMSLKYVFNYISDETNIIDCTLDPGSVEGETTCGVNVIDSDDIDIIRCDVEYADVGFMIHDSTNVKINGDDSERNDINYALTILGIYSTSTASTVWFENYDITDYDETMDDMDLRGTSSYTTTLYWDDLAVGGEEVDSNGEFTSLLTFYQTSPDYYTLIPLDP